MVLIRGGELLQWYMVLLLLHGRSLEIVVDRLEEERGRGVFSFSSRTTARLTFHKTHFRSVVQSGQHLELKHCVISVAHHI